MTVLILASQSAARAALLRGAGIPFQTRSPGVDESAVKLRLLAAGSDPRAIALALAQEKAIKASGDHSGLVLGADQTLDLDGELYDKAETLDQARSRLQGLRGRPHQLHAGVAIARDGALIWSEVVSATLRMRAFSDAYLEQYLARQGEAVLGPVGCYHLEGEGIQLFDAIEGDYFAILGLPLAGLLPVLRQYEVIVS